MQRTPVASSSLVSVGYDPTYSVLEVEFTGGTVYQYFGVPRSAVELLGNASSKGATFNATIRSRYPCVRIY
jgi:hypothetical protein